MFKLPRGTMVAPLLIACIMISVLMGTALVSPLYPIYQMSWSLSISQVSNIYVIYMIGALACLLMLGRLADRWGARNTLALSLGLGLFGTVLSMLVDDYYSFSFARFLVGIAGSLATTAGAVAITAAMPENRRHLVALFISLTVAVGFALGPLVGGLIGHFSAAPLTSVFYPVVALLLIAVALLPIVVAAPVPMPMPMPVPAAVAVPVAVPGKVQATALNARDFLPKLRWAAKGERLRFAFICGVPFVGFGVFGLQASLMPVMFEDMTGFSGPLVSGISLAAFLLLSAVVQIFANRLSGLSAATAGLVCMGISTLGMLVNLLYGSPILFGLSGLLAILGHGMGQVGSLIGLYRVSDPSNRGALTATYMAIGYSGGIFPLFAVGWIADHVGVQMASGLFFGFITVLAIALAVMNWLLFRPQRAERLHVARR